MASAISVVIGVFVLGMLIYNLVLQNLIFSGSFWDIGKSAP